MSRKHTKITEYLLVALLAPLFVIKEFSGFSEDLSLAMTGGKYSGRGSLAGRRKYKRAGDYIEDVDWLRPPDYSIADFKTALWRTRKKDFIKKQVGNDGKAELVITKTGKNEIEKRFPLIKLQGKQWKGWWLIVAFDIPEEDSDIRNKLRDQLILAGFAQWQKSVYVSPHDIANEMAEIIKENDLSEEVVPMIAKRIFAKSDWKLAKKLYKIDLLETKYQKIAKLLRESKGTIPYRQKLLRKQWAEFLEVIRQDPFLPQGLAPQNGYGREIAFRALREFTSTINSEIY